MGTAQSTEEAGKCPLPGKAFEATPNNVVRATQQAYNRMRKIEKKLSPEIIGDTVETSKNGESAVLTENSHPSSPTFVNLEGKRPLPQEGVSNPSLLTGIENGIRIKQEGGMKYLKTLKVKELREVLKQNRIKITHKGKYLNKKQMIHKLKMIKWN